MKERKLNCEDFLFLPVNRRGWGKATHVRDIREVIQCHTDSVHNVTQIQHLSNQQRMLLLTFTLFLIIINYQIFIVQMFTFSNINSTNVHIFKY